MRIALVLSLAVVLVGSIRFGRFDWTGIPFERGPMTTERVVSAECTERIRPYTTESGRVIAPVSVDEQQYMSLVEYLRGTPRDELHVDCVLDPFASRPALPWVASRLPFDEGTSLAIVNLALVLLATWATVFALRAQGFSGRVVALAGTLFAVGWNTLFFSSVILLDAGVVGLVALCWYLLAIRRPWWIVPILLVSYPVKEIVAVIVLPVLAAWAYDAYRSGRSTRTAAVAPVVAAGFAAVVSLAVFRSIAIDADATWDLGINLGAVLNNLLGPVGLVSFLLATVWIYIPALLVIRGRVRADGVVDTLRRPAVLGVAITVALCAWTVLAADLSPRFAWVGFPFAATLAAEWLSTGRASERLRTLRLPAWLDAGGSDPGESDPARVVDGR